MLSICYFIARNVILSQGIVYVNRDFFKMRVKTSVLYFISKTVLQVEIWGLAFSVENNHPRFSKS